MIPRPYDLVVTKWRALYQGRSYPVSVGRGGIGVKQGEGDGITPVGCWQIVGSGYRADRLRPLRTSFRHKPIAPHDIWSDDADDLAYNHQLAARHHPFSHERLFRADPLYDVFAILNFNWPIAVPGAGSAIFIHSWRKPRHPTEGCVAFAPEVLHHILETWQPWSRVIIKA